MQRLNFVSLLAALVILTGCGGKLQDGGAYNPPASTNELGVVSNPPADTKLWVADNSFKLAYEALDKVFLFEFQNRELLKGVAPRLKPALDDLRGKANEIVAQWAAARSAYLAAPSPQGQDKLTDILTELNRLNTVATAALANR